MRQVPTGYQIKKAQTTDALRGEIFSKRRNKYNAKRTVVDGITFDSKGEALHYSRLKLRVRAGEISHLECHPVFTLNVNGQVIGKIIPDFRYIDVATGKVVVEDFKSEATAKNSLFQFKKKLFEAQHGMTLHVVMAGRAA